MWGLELGGSVWNAGEGFRVAAPIRSDGIVGHFSTYPGRQQTGVQRIVKYLCFWSTTTTTTTTTATKKNNKNNCKKLLMLLLHSYRHFDKMFCWENYQIASHLILLAWCRFSPVGKNLVSLLWGLGRDTKLVRPKHFVQLESFQTSLARG